MEAVNARKDHCHECTEEVPRGVEGRATRLAVEARRDPERSEGAIRRIADELGVYPRGSAHLGEVGRDRRRHPARNHH